MHRNFGAIHDSASNAIEPHSVHKDQADAPIRLGFVSADLRKHPVAVMLQSVWPWLVSDPRLQVFVYYTHPHSDAVTATFKCDRVEWRDVATDSDETLCRLIRADRIDILIDLSGHTAGNRLPVFGRKPAPVQMSWLGYPFSTGLKTMDYHLRQKVGR
jgi:predicted O-linked N-acetylglucosamine transferase (SPINDLY family)